MPSETLYCTNILLMEANPANSWGKHSLHSEGMFPHIDSGILFVRLPEGGKTNSSTTECQIGKIVPAIPYL